MIWVFQFTFWRLREYFNFSIFCSLSWIICSTSVTCNSNMREHRLTSFIHFWMASPVKIWYKLAKYQLLIRWFGWSSRPVVIRHICQNVVDAEVGPAREHSLAVGAVFGLVSPPVAADAGQAEAVSARYSDRVGEDVLTQRAQEVLLREETDCGGHFLKMESRCCLIPPKFHLKTMVTKATLQNDVF